MSVLLRLKRNWPTDTFRRCVRDKDNSEVGEVHFSKGDIVELEDDSIELLAVQNDIGKALEQVSIEDLRPKQPTKISGPPPAIDKLPKPPTPNALTETPGGGTKPSEGGTKPPEGGTNPANSGMPDAGSGEQTADPDADLKDVEPTT